MDYLYRLEQIQPSDRSLVGDKAFYLGLLKQQGYPVLPGIVVSAAMLQAFLEKIAWQNPMLTDLPHSSLHVDVDQPQQLQGVTQQIRQAILSGEVPEAWVVAIAAAIQDWRRLEESSGENSGQALIFRPSFILQTLDSTVCHRTSGLLESHLSGWSQEAIAQSLKQTWAELFRARSLLYWQRLGIQLQQINLAILIQPIESAIASGNVQVSPDYLDIQATWGLGQAWVNGEVVPDRYRIHRQTESRTQTLGSKMYAYTLALAEDSPVVRYIRQPNQDVSPSTRPALSEDQLQSLKRLVQQTAANPAIPLNLEWTLCQFSQQQPELYITQAIPQLMPSSLHQEADQPGEALQPAHPLAPQPTLLTGTPASGGTIAAVAWVCQLGETLASIPTQAILVASMITPDQVAGLHQVAGIITEQGGMTSHAAILAREMGIPAVVGVRHATQRIQTGDRLWVNGDRGEVHLALGEQEFAAHQVKTPSFPASFPVPRSALSPQPRSPKIATQLWVTLSQPQAIAEISRLSVDGIGLLRSELLLMTALQNQEQGLSDRIAESVQPFVAAFAPRPVFYRSLDLRSHEFPHLTNFAETNPALGLRGTFSYQINATLFDQELAALRQVQQNGYKNLHLILPFVRTVEEFVFCRQRVEQAGLTQNPHFQLWIMAEVPSVLLLLPDYVRAGVQGIAIGTNDLTQLLLGVDRDHPQMQTVFDQHHPAVMRALQYLIQTAQQLGIPCSICGEAVSQHIEIIESLIRWGITSLSIDPQDIERVHAAIARSEQRILLEAAINSTS
ncbi:MAG: phosphoenolpyruvate synthase [Oscillatoriophycideae cyanobacterium NC_groundwater_1537_Pr4_S-0.65um_50_18]|nr:phosphoenolpyruvate synthase [Oscillatoriophycideae cyanobacterium NC_groundwater_1537_Pr4_S-0.65um_50_18]